MEAKTFEVKTAIIRGAEPVPVVVEARVMPGIPGVSITGMADGAVFEARSRVRCALRSCGYELPRTSVFINLAPAGMRKEGGHLDLPIAVALLAVSGQIPTGWLDGCLLAGGLGLDGAVFAPQSAAAMQMLAAAQGDALVTGGEAEVLGGCGACLSLGTLADLRAGAGGASPVPPVAPAPMETLDFADISGEVVKRALAVAVAGGHGIALVGGSPARRRAIARRIPSIMPAMTEGEMREAARIHSAAGESIAPLAAGARPFRSPSHAISCAGIVGGGRPVRPGEASLAHAGVLYLDDAGEWRLPGMQMLRTSGREGCVRIVRAEGIYEIPARFQLVAGCEPCPCGGYGQRGAECRCSEAKVERYRAVLAGRLLGAGAGMRVHVADGGSESGGWDSSDLRRMVERARSFAAGRGRYEGTVSKRCADFIGECSEARGIDPMRLRDISRTIADMDESEHIHLRHAQEASVYAIGRAI